MFYEPQATQMNKESPQELSFNLTLILHPHDENFEPQKLFPHLKIKPLQA
jgi:hypothetical protein